MDRLPHRLDAEENTENHEGYPLALVPGEYVGIEQADYVDGYKIHLRFSNGFERMFDFEPFLTQSPNRLIRRYLDMQEFRGFYLEHGDLVWDDYNLCFPIADLYRGQL